MIISWHASGSRDFQSEKDALGIMEGGWWVSIYWPVWLILLFFDFFFRQVVFVFLKLIPRSLQARAQKKEKRSELMFDEGNARNVPYGSQSYDTQCRN